MSDYDFNVDYIDDEFDDEDYYEEEGDEIGEIVEDEGEIEEEKDFEIMDESKVIDETEIYDEIKKVKIKKTSKFITKFEKTRIIGYRALQISMGAETTILNLIDNYPNITDPYEIALLEYKNKILPLKIKRFIRKNEFEEWNVNELEEP